MMPTIRWVMLLAPRGFGARGLAIKLATVLMMLLGLAMALMILWAILLTPRESEPSASQ